MKNGDQRLLREIKLDLASVFYAERVVPEKEQDYPWINKVSNIQCMKLSVGLEKYLKMKGLSLSELARRSGVPKSTLAAWRVGRKTVNVEQIRAVAEVLEVSIHELLFGEPDKYQALTSEILSPLFEGDLRVSISRINKKNKGGSF